MIRFIVRTAVALAANAAGLLVAAALLEGVQLDVGAFIVAVVVFMVVYALMLPFLASRLRRQGDDSSAIGGVTLIASLVGLVVTDIVTDGLDRRSGGLARRGGGRLGRGAPGRVHPAVPRPEEVHGRAPGLTDERRGQIAEALGRSPTIVRRGARFYHRLGPWYEAHYGLFTDQPEHVESGLAGIEDRL